MIIGHPLTRGCCDGGVVIRCTVDLGLQYTVEHKDDPMRTSWQDFGFDSAYAAAGVIGKRPEHCVADPSRVTIEGLETSGHHDWIQCTSCNDMIYMPTCTIPRERFLCRRCR